MKVRALNHLRQTVGALSVERVLGTEFEIDDETGVAAVTAGLVAPLEPVKPSKQAKNRETK